MFNFIINSFFARIHFDADIMEAIARLNRLEWCKNVGKALPTFDCPYDILPCEENFALKYLQREEDKGDEICLENFYFECSNNFLSSLVEKNNPKIDATKNKVSRKATILIDLDRIIAVQNNFNIKYGIDTNLYLYEIATDIILELYFSKLYSDIPTFLLNLIDIYEKGHIVIGWKGDNPENIATGKLLVF